VRSSLVLPQTSWSSFPDLMSYFFFLFTAKILFFCLQQKPTSYALFLHKLTLPPPRPPLPPPCSCLLIQLPLVVALESHGIFNESALKRLVTCDSKYILQSKPFSRFFTQVFFSEQAYLSHTSRVNFFFFSLCLSVYTHHVAADNQ